VLLYLGARPNQKPQHTNSGNTHDTAAGSPNRSGRFLKPVRPLLLDLASRRQGKSVRPVWQTGQTDFVQKLPKDPNTSRAFPHLNKRSHGTTETSLLKNTSRQPTGRNRLDRFGKPVRPVLPGQSGRTPPAEKTQHFLQSISRFIPRIKVRLWG
jgi:hypothetical protein